MSSYRVIYYHDTILRYDSEMSFLYGIVSKPSELRAAVNVLINLSNAVARCKSLGVLQLYDRLIRTSEHWAINF